MKQYPLIQSKAGTAAFYLYLCATIMLSRNSMFCVGFLGFFLSQWIYVGITAGLLLWFLYVNRGHSKELLGDSRILWTLFCAAILLLPMVIKRDWQTMYFSILFALCIPVFFTFFVSVQDTAKCYVILLSAFAVYSLITSYLLRIPADRGILVPPIAYRTEEINLYNYFFSFVSVWYVKNRNFGIFREPGVYQFFLMLGLYLNHYRIAWKKPSHMWIVSGIFAITMLSTFATGGVIELGLFVVVLYLDKKWYRSKQGRLLAIGAIALFLAACAFVVIQHGALYEELYLMLEKFGNGSDSITDRVGSPIVNAKLFLSSPIVGRSVAEVLYAIYNNTSSSSILFAILGLAGGLLHVVSWFALVWKKDSAVWVNLALLLILAMSFNTQNLITDPLFWMFPMMALTESLVPVLEKRSGK